MKVLITGATGFIGTNLFNFIKDKYEVYGIGFGNNSGRVFNCDLIDLENTKKILSENIQETDVIIHLASSMANEANLNDVNILNNNNLLSQNVTLLAKHLKAKKIINFSSSSVYPNIDGEFSEDSIINPSVNTDAFYGLSKFNSEIIINRLSETGVTVSHLRCVMVYGDGVNPTRIWPVMEKELKEKNTITVFGNGKRLINQLHISSLSTVIQKFIDHQYPGVFNVSDETLSLKHLAERIIKEHGNAESKIIEVEKGNTFQFRINTAKYKALP